MTSPDDDRVITDVERARMLAACERGKWFPGLLVKLILRDGQAWAELAEALLHELEARDAELEALRAATETDAR